MPNFWNDGERHFVAYITGPAHVLLGLALSDGGGGTDVVMTRRSGRCGFGSVDDDAVRQAVLAGVTAANAALGSHWQPVEIVYVEDDTHRYSLYEHCAKLIVEHVNGGSRSGSGNP